jgi:hypothetical protein
MKVKHLAAAIALAFAASAAVAAGDGSGAGDGGSGAAAARAGAVEGIGASGRTGVNGATGELGSEVPGGLGTPGPLPPAGGKVGTPGAGTTGVVPPAGRGIGSGGATPPSAQIDPLANQFWTQNSREGFLTRDEALGFRGADNNALDWDRLDTDLDGRVSQSEWSTYHSPRATIPGVDDFGAGGRPGLPGAPGRNVR